ncbi:hypothetical protein WJX77_008360 [Trebouxia sp. C0004]
MQMMACRGFLPLLAGATPFQVLNKVYTAGKPSLHQLTLAPSAVDLSLQDAVDQSLATGYHDGIEKILHTACQKLIEYGHPQIVCPTRFAAKLVFHTLGEAAWQRQLPVIHSAPGHAHWQVARGYWFEIWGAKPCVMVTNHSDCWAQISATLCNYLVPKITVANKHSQKMASFNALNIAGLPACRLNDYIEPHLIDDVKPIHMIVTTPDWFDTLYQKQSVRKQDSAQFQTGVLRLDLSSVFDRLRLELGEAASGLDDLEAMAISADVNEGIFVMEPRHPVKHP